MSRLRKIKFNIEKREFNLLYITTKLCPKVEAIKIAEQSAKYYKDQIFLEVLVNRYDFTPIEAITYAKKTGTWSVLKSALERIDVLFLEIDDSIPEYQDFKIWKKIIKIQQQILDSTKDDLRILWWQSVFIKSGLSIVDAIKYLEVYETIETE